MSLIDKAIEVLERLKEKPEQADGDLARLERVVRILREAQSEYDVKLATLVQHVERSAQTALRAVVVSIIAVGIALIALVLALA